MKEENPENLHEKSQERTNKEPVDFCNPCHQYGKRSEMFCCAECLQAFHPSCISAYPTRTREDIRFKHFICPPCALDKSKRSRQKRKRKKQWNSDSDQDYLNVVLFLLSNASYQLLVVISFTSMLFFLHLSQLVFLLSKLSIYDFNSQQMKFISFDFLILFCIYVLFIFIGKI